MMSPGTKLGGRYRLDVRIATGGMGDVWRATDEVLGREVAVKVLLPSLLSEPGFIERFRAEARMVATLTHPNIVRVYDYGESPMAGGGGVAYLVMEFVSGHALTEKLKRHGRLTAAEALPLLAQAAEALHAAHIAGVVHRDVKPGNLLIDDSGSVMLTDFGIARSGLTGGLTQAGSVLGTAAYVSPEQAQGFPVTGQSDVYSLGIVAYQCLAGRRPWDSDNPVELIMRHVNDVPPPLPDDVDEPVRAFVLQALEKDPARRFSSGAEMAEAARAIIGGGSFTPPPSYSPPEAPHSPPAGPSGPVTPPGYGPGHGTAVPPPGRGLDDRTSVAPMMMEPETPAPVRRRNKLLVIVAASTLGVVLLTGGIWAATANSPENDDPPPVTETDESADGIDIVVEDYLNRSPKDVEQELRELGFTNVEVKGIGRFVKNVTPNGLQDPETLIMVETSNTRVEPEPTGTSSDQPSQGDNSCSPGVTICIPKFD